MNAKTLTVAFLVTFAAAGAFASEFNGEATYEHPQVSTSGLSREQVKAELSQAQAADQIAYGETGAKVVQGESTKTRAEVREETIKAASQGSLLRNGEG